MESQWRPQIDGDNTKSIKEPAEVENGNKINAKESQSWHLDKCKETETYAAISNVAVVEEMT